MDIGSKTILHTRRRSDESPLDYLYRLNVTGLRASLKIKDGNAYERREHVDHYIETLEDQDLAKRISLLRLPDADDLEEALRARDRAKNRQKKAAFGSSKYRQKLTNYSTPSAQRSKCIQANDSGSDSESDGSGGSDSDVDRHRRIFFAANEDVTPQVEKELTKMDPRFLDRDHGHHITRSTVMVLTTIDARTVDPESTRILVAGGVLHTRSAS
ncbi:hypothetical protein PHMEG_0001475 [Phytophthora megakarya]|uniref:Uncharacterized protein n=1 Tax=Phytophthora megakarya TaxID=4795 RepID=A0A225X1L9_9STRA|nr:hypothetical protein PHMEG_0001475 [Phytophthora megakarya]